MNRVRELRIKKGIQAKQLALEIGVSNATVSDWEHGRKNPRGQRLEKLANFFCVDEGYILGYGTDIQDIFMPEDPQTSGKSRTDQIIERIINKLDGQPKTQEAQIISTGIDKMPQEDRKRALNILSAAFSDYFDHAEDKIG